MLQTAKKIVAWFFMAKGMAAKLCKPARRVGSRPKTQGVGFGWRSLPITPLPRTRGG
jgi:hypothetical protein